MVDIVDFNDDKDKLKDEEFFKIQNNYVNEILKEGETKHLHYLQYLVGIVINTEKKILYIESSDLFDIRLMYDDKSEHIECIYEHWKTVFDNNKTGWKAIGKAKIDNAIHNYYLYEFDESVCDVNKALKHEWLKLENYLEKNNNIFIQKFLIHRFSL